MNKVSIAKWETMLQENTEKVEIVGLDGVEMIVKHRLSLREMMQFVEDVVSSCVNQEDGTFHPEVRGLAIKTALVSTYANFNIPSNSEKLYELLYGTDVVAQILDKIDEAQYTEILSAIDQRIDFAVRMMESQTAVEVSEVVGRVNLLSTQLDSIFGDLDSAQFKELLEDISRISHMDEGEYARAVIAAKSNPVADVEESAADGDSDESILKFPTDEA